MLKAIDKWLPGYLASVLRRPRKMDVPRHLLFCVADHYEPLGRGVDRDVGMAMVDRWVQQYPNRFERFRDADGRPPCHSIFYPAEEYDRECIDRIGALCAGGFAEVEVHLHHRDDTRDGLMAKLVAIRDRLHQDHGMLGADVHGAARYGFIHGNWALCNSHPGGDWCGVNDEIDVLLETGCYADFTFPSAPSATQPKMVNAIYRAANCPGRPRSHDRGAPVTAGSLSTSGRGSSQLLLVTGPLALNWENRKWGLLPRVENGDMTGVNPPNAGRADLWVQQHVHVRGRAEWVMVKVHTHGCVEANAGVMLGEPMQALHKALAEKYNDGRQWCLHYVSAREMANIVLAAEAGCSGNPTKYRDYCVFTPGISSHLPTLKPVDK